MNKKPINSNPTKEFFLLLRTIEKTTKNQAKIKSYNPEDISSFVVEICPKKGLYQHAKFLFQIQLISYPREFPNVICLSDIYHPNIEHGEGYHNVCLNLFDNWNRSFGLIDVIQGLIFLLYQPNLSDPISSFFNSKNTNDEVFRKNVFTSLHGGTVDGIEFLPNPGISEYNDCNQNRQNGDIVNQESVENQTISEESPTEKETVEEIVQPSEKDPETEKYVIKADEEEKLSAVMTNNNAAQISQTIETVSEINPADCEHSDYNSETDENLPIREVISPNAFYSDLICSRYAQPDMFSDSEYDTSEIWDTSIICDNFGLPSSSYASAESDYERAFGFIYDHEDDDLSDDNDDIEFQRGCLFITVPSNVNDPSYVFLRKWVDLRRQLNISSETPKPVTTVVLTKVLNPFRSVYSTFVYLNEDQNDGNWLHYHDNSVRRVNREDRSLHWMIWAQNISRWSMNHIFKLSMLDWGFDSFVWYSMFVGLSYKINQRSCEIYNCKETSDFTCIFIK